MATFVVLLRGINVGGRRSLKMSDLKTVLEQAGGSRVATYIQSGNAVLSHPARSAAKLEADIEQRLLAATGMAIPVVLRSAAQWDDIVAGNPFPKVGPQQLHLVTLKTRVPQPAYPGLDVKKFLPEEVIVGSQHLYLHLPNGMGRAKLPLTLERLGPTGTARNWGTVLALAELSAGISNN